MTLAFNNHEGRTPGQTRSDAIRSNAVQFPSSEQDWFLLLPSFWHGMAWSWNDDFCLFETTMTGLLAGSVTMGITPLFFMLFLGGLFCIYG